MKPTQHYVTGIGDTKARSSFSFLIDVQSPGMSESICFLKQSKAFHVVTAKQCIKEVEEGY